MQWGRIVDIAASIVVVAGLTVALTSPNTSAVIGAVMTGFSNSLRAAMGK